MISTLAWVARGVARQEPRKYELDERELARIQELAELELEDAREALSQAQHLMDGYLYVYEYFSALDWTAFGSEEDDVDMEEQQGEVESVHEADQAGVEQDQAEVMEEDEEARVLREYNLDTYDQDVDGNATTQDMSLFQNLASGLAVFQDNKEDPYITIPEEEDLEERQDLEIAPTDRLILAGKTEENLSHLEVYVFDMDQDNLYVHHDILLPSFPLCVEPIHFDFGSAEGNGQNFCAIGTFESEIEIWNLDVMDAMYPHAILGHQAKEASGNEQQNSSKKKTKKKNKNKDVLSSERHTGAVLSLSWNRHAKNLLASASADTTVKLWDLSSLTCVHDYRHHTGKVAAISFHPQEATVLLTAGYDQRVIAMDARTPDAISQWKTTADVECLRWDPHAPASFLVSTENGIVQYFDCRMMTTDKKSKKPAAVFTLAAHSNACSALDVNPFIPGMMITGGSDKVVKLWDIANGQPRMITSKDVGAGRIFTASFCTDSPYHCAVGGSKGDLSIWNLTESAAVRKTFHGRPCSLGTVHMNAQGALGEEDILPTDAAASPVEQDDVDSDAEELEQVLQEMQGVAIRK